MRTLIILLLVSQFGFATKKSCKNLDAKVEAALKSQGILSSRGIRGPVRDELTKLIDDGFDINPMFLQQVVQRKGYVPKGFKDKDKLVAHAKKHGGEFDFKSENQYLREADKFAKSIHDDIMTFRSSKDIYRYNPKTNEFMVMERTGKVIGTYYKPDLAKINKKRIADKNPPFNNITEWFIKNKWERFVLNKDFK